jgi:hypothetical protein
VTWYTKRIRYSSLRSKPMTEIVKLIEPTVNIEFFMKPKMNIKAQEDKVKFF